MSYIIVSTTTSNKKDAEGLSIKIIKAKLGACAQITEVISIYEWKGKIENTREFKLEIKTTSNKFSRLRDFIIKNHKYDIPEIIAKKIIAGNNKYLNWMDKSLK